MEVINPVSAVKNSFFVGIGLIFSNLIFLPGKLENLNTSLFLLLGTTLSILTFNFFVKLCLLLIERSLFVAFFLLIGNLLPLLKTLLFLLIFSFLLAFLISYLIKERFSLALVQISLLSSVHLYILAGVNDFFANKILGIVMMVVQGVISMILITLAVLNKEPEELRFKKIYIRLLIGCATILFYVFI